LQNDYRGSAINKTTKQNGRSHFHASNNTVGVPFGLGILQTAWEEKRLIKYGSAIEDLIMARTKLLFRNIYARNYMYIGSKPEGMQE
jgi:hypothetical protein